MSFNVDGAIKAGYKIDEIADHLGKKAGFDVGAARQSGYSDDEIVEYLRAGKPAKTPQQKTAKAEPPQVAYPSIEDSTTSAPTPERRPTEVINPEWRKAPRQSLISRGLNIVGRALNPYGTGPIQTAMLGVDAAKRALSSYDTTETMSPADIALAQIARETGEGWSTVVDPARRIEKGFAPIPRLAAAGLKQSEGGAIRGIAEMKPNVRSAYLGPVAGPLSMLVPQKAWQKIGEAGQSYANEGVREHQKVKEEYPVEVGTPESMMQSAGQSIIEQAVPMAASVVTGNPAPALLAMSGMTAARDYHGFRERGHSPEVSSIASTATGAIEGATELLPVGAFLKLAGGKQALVKSLVGLYGSEIPGEMIATVTQDMIDKSMVRPDMTVGEMGQEIKKYFTSGEAALMQKETIGSAGIQTTLMGMAGSTPRILSRAANRINGTDPITQGMTISSPAASGLPLLTVAQAARRNKLSGIMEKDTEADAQARLRAIEARKRGEVSPSAEGTSSTVPESEQVAAEPVDMTEPVAPAKPEKEAQQDLPSLEARHAKLKVKIFDEEGNQREGVSQKAIDNYNALTAAIESQRAEHAKPTAIRPEASGLTGVDASVMDGFTKTSMKPPVPPSSNVEAAGGKPKGKSPYGTGANWVKTDKTVTPDAVVGVVDSDDVKTKVMNRIDGILPETSPSGHPQTKQHLTDVINAEELPGGNVTVADIEAAGRNIKANGTPQTDVEMALVRVLADDVRSNRHKYEVKTQGEQSDIQPREAEEKAEVGKRQPVIVKALDRHGNTIYVDKTEYNDSTKNILRKYNAKGERLASDNGIHWSNIIFDLKSPEADNARKIKRLAKLEKDAGKRILTDDEKTEYRKLEKEVNEASSGELKRTQKTDSVTALPEEETASSSTIPPEVLAEYPDLQPGAAEETPSDAKKDIPAHVSLPAGWKMEVGKTRTKEGHTFEAWVDWQGKRLVFSEQKHMDNPEIVNHEIAHVVIETLPEAKRDALFDEYIKVAGLDEWTVKNNFHYENIAMDYGDYLTNPGSTPKELKAVFDKYLGEGKAAEKKQNPYDENVDKVAYHASKEDFETFDKSKIGSFTGENFFGKGFSFADTKDTIAPYGTPRKFRIQGKFFKAADENDFRKYNSAITKRQDEIAKELIAGGMDAVKAVRESRAQAITEVLKAAGYDGVIGYNRILQQNEYTVFEPESISKAVGSGSESSTISPETRRKNLEKRLAIARNTRERESIRAKLEKLKKESHKNIEEIVAANDAADLMREEKKQVERAKKVGEWRSKYMDRIEMTAAGDIVRHDHEKLNELVESNKISAGRAHQMIDDAVASGVVDSKVGEYMKSRVKVEEKAEPAPQHQAKKSLEPQNAIFTEDAYQKARARMKAKLSQLNAGFDPELLQDGITIAGYHLERGARKFADYTKAMVDEFGDAIRPYLKAFYNGVRDLPGIEWTSEMDDYQTVQGASVEKGDVQQNRDLTPTESTKIPVIDSGKGKPAQKSPEQELYDRATEAHAHVSMNPAVAAKVWRDGMVFAAEELRESLEKIAKSGRQNEAIAAQVNLFKQGYVEHARPILSAISRQVSSMVAGKSQFSKNHDKRNSGAQSAEQKANDAFTKWQKEAKEYARQAILNARTPEEVKADEQAAADEVKRAATAKHNKELSIVKQWMALKPGDMVDVGGNGKVAIAKKNRKSIETEGGAKWTITELLGIESKKADELMAEAEAEIVSDTPFTLASHDSLFKRLRDGEPVTVDEVKKGFDSLVEGEEAIKAELQAMKKDDLLKRMGRFSAGRYKNEKKDVIVSAIYRGMVTDFAYLDGSNSLSYGMRDKVSDVVRKRVEKLTEEGLKKYAEAVAKERDDYKTRMEGYVKAIKDPETWEEFQKYRELGYKIEDLPPEKLKLHDELKAEHNRERKAREAEKKATVSQVKTDVEMTLKETTHTKKGTPLFVVQLSDRVERDVYNELNAAAKKLGGYYSSFRGAGAAPGFQFKTREDAEKFMAIREGDVSRADKLGEKAEERQEKKVSKLRAVAESLKEKAEEQLSSDRLTNTAKRARQANGAEESARSDIQLAETMLNLADAIESGEATHLDGVAAKTHVETLKGLLRSAKYAYEKAKDIPYIDSKNRTVTEDDVDFAKYPYPAQHESHIRTLATFLKDKKGAAMDAAWLGKMAKERTHDSIVSFIQPGDIERLESILAKTKRFVKDSSAKSAIENIADRMQDYNRLQRMGIPDLPSLRAALREFLKFRAGRREADKAKQLERDLVGKKVGVDFFPTPPELAGRMVEMAGVEPGMRVLEPSAGNGNIAEAIRDAGVEPDVAEISSSLREVLEAKGFAVVGQDFMDVDGEYDAIIMNPPFSDNQDIEHVRHAFGLLKPGGKLVAIMGEGAFFRGGKTENSFREWIDEQGADVEKLPEGTFTDKRLLNTTGVNARLVVVEKGGVAEKPEASDNKIIASLKEVVSRIGTITKTSEAQKLDDDISKISDEIKRFNSTLAYRLMKKGEEGAYAATKLNTAEKITEYSHIVEKQRVADLRTAIDDAIKLLEKEDAENARIRKELEEPAYLPVKDMRIDELKRELNELTAEVLSEKDKLVRARQHGGTADSIKKQIDKWVARQNELNDEIDRREAEELKAPTWHTELPEQGFPVEDSDKNKYGTEYYSPLINKVLDDAINAITQVQWTNGEPLYARILPAKGEYNGRLRLVPRDQQTPGWEPLSGEAFRIDAITRDQLREKLRDLLRRAPILGEKVEAKTEKPPAEPIKFTRATPKLGSQERNDLEREKRNLQDQISKVNKELDDLAKSRRRSKRREKIDEILNKQAAQKERLAELTRRLKPLEETDSKASFEDIAESARDEVARQVAIILSRGESPTEYLTKSLGELVKPFVEATDLPEIEGWTAQVVKSKATYYQTPFALGSPAVDMKTEMGQTVATFVKDAVSILGNLNGEAAQYRKRAEEIIKDSKTIAPDTIRELTALYHEIEQEQAKDKAGQDAKIHEVYDREPVEYIMAAMKPLLSKEDIKTTEDVIKAFKDGLLSHETGKGSTTTYDELPDKEKADASLAGLLDKNAKVSVLKDRVTLTVKGDPLTAEQKKENKEKAERLTEQAEQYRKESDSLEENGYTDEQLEAYEIKDAAEAKKRLDYQVMNLRSTADRNMAEAEDLLTAKNKDAKHTFWFNVNPLEQGAKAGGTALFWNYGNDVEQYRNARDAMKKLSSLDKTFAENPVLTVVNKGTMENPDFKIEYHNGTFHLSLNPIAFALEHHNKTTPLSTVLSSGMEPYLKDGDTIRLSPGYIQNRSEEVFLVPAETMNSEKGKVFFSYRSTPATKGTEKSAIEKAISPLLKKWKNAPEVKVVQSESELPENLKAEMASVGAQGEVDGVFDGGVVYLIADNMPNARDAVRVLLHEAVGHYGLRGFLGVKFKSLLQDAYYLYGEKGFRDIANRYDLDLSNPDDRLVAAEEKLAELAESGEKPGLIRRATAMIREWLRSIGVDISLSDNDVKALISRAARWVERGREDGRDDKGGDAGRDRKAGLYDTGRGGLLENGTRFSRRNRTGDPDTDAVLDKIGRPDKTIMERIRDIIKERAPLRVEQGLFDQFASIKQYDETAYIMTRMTTGFSDTFMAMLEHGAPIWANGWVKVDSRDNGIMKIFEPVAEDLDLFLGWMVGERAQKLMNEGRENYFTQAEINKLKVLKTQENAVRWEKVRNNYVQYKKKVLDFAEQAGVINSEARKVWDHEEYVPFYRITEEANGTSKVQGPRGKRGIASQHSGIRTLKGGTSQLGDVFENILQNFSHLVHASIKNRAATEALRAAEAAGAASTVKWDWKAAHIETKQIVKKIREELGADDILEDEEDQLDDFLTLFYLARPKGTAIVHYLEDGKPKYYEVHDDLLLRSLANINSQPFQGYFMDLARITKRLMTVGITSMPGFMVRNIARDTVHVAAISGTNFIPVVSSMQGFMKAFREDDDMVQLMAAGGSFHGGWAYGHDMKKAANHAKHLMRKKGVDSSVIDSIANLWDVYQKVGSAMENAARVKVYDLELKDTGDHLRAAYKAKDLMDFSLHGDWKAVKFLCETVIFLQARIQSLHRLGRTAGSRQQLKSLAVVGTYIALASVLLYLFNRDDDRYKELEEWDKDAFWHFWIGEHHFRFPKPFEVGALFGTMAERITELAIEEAHDGKLFASRLYHMLTQTFALGLPHVGSELYQQAVNKDSFTGRPIVNSRLKGMLPEDQKEPWTSETVIAMAKVPGPSLMGPKRLEHFIEGYTGTLGAFIMGCSDMIIRKSMGYPDRPAMTPAEYPIVGSFYRGKDDRGRNTKYVTEFYNLMNEVDETYRSVQGARQLGNAERYEEIVSDKKQRDLLNIKKPLDKRREDFTDINRETRRIYADREMTPKQKRERLNELTGIKNDIAKDTIRRIEAAGISIPR